MKLKETLHAPIMRVTATIGAVWLVLIALVVASYYLTAFVYGRLGWQPSPLAAQIINTLVGFCLLRRRMAGSS